MSVNFSSREFNQDVSRAKKAALQGEAGFSADYREGVLSFLEGRPAHFKGE